MAQLLQIENLYEHTKSKNLLHHYLHGWSISTRHEYVEDMKRHPQRIFWKGKEGKKDDELVIEQIAHRILSGFYNDDALNAGKHIMKMEVG